MLRVLSVVAAIAVCSAPTFGSTVTAWATDLGIVPEYGRGYTPWHPGMSMTEAEWDEFVELGGGWDHVFPPFSTLDITLDMLRSLGWDEHDEWDFDEQTGQITIYKDVYTDEDLAQPIHLTALRDGPPISFGDSFYSLAAPKADSPAAVSAPTPTALLAGAAVLVGFTLRRRRLS